MKRILLILGGLIFAVAAVGGIKEVAWHFYIPPKIVGFGTNSHAMEDMEDVDGRGLESLAKEWLKSYEKEAKGWKVPYGYRVFDIEEISVTDLDLDGYVQIDYLVTLESANQQIISALELAGTKDGYIGQMVLRWERENGEWVIKEKLRPVQYQLRTPEMQEEIRTPKTEHYAMSEEQCTYMIRDEKLYVTYDGGEKFVEVPEGYEKVCAQSNSIYREWLPDNSYVVTPEFTAFLAYEDSKAILLYSEDMGKTWKESEIFQGFAANCFVSKTEHTCFVSFAVDRAGGSDYYTIMKSSDMRTWTKVEFDDVPASNFTVVYWADDNTGYVAKKNQEGSFFLTVDGGKTFTNVEYPVPDTIVDDLGFNPFDEVEKMYQKDGKIYMVVGQGDDGDYARNGELVKALYESTDGKSFTFKGEIFDSPVETG